MVERVHVYIARGPNAASADFDAVDLDDAKEHASTLWDEPTKNLTAHPTSECSKKGCTG